MLPLDQDINVAYGGGCGGFYFFHQLLLCDRHWAKLKLWPLQKQAVVNSLTQQQQQRLRTTRERFFDVWAPGCPSYPDYFGDQKPIPPHIAEIYHSAALEDPANFEDIPGAWPLARDLAVDYQWSIAHPSEWKKNELLVDNINPVLEKEWQYYQYLPEHYHRAYLFCGGWTQWAAWPGVKVMLFTDIRSQFALCKFKNTQTFQNETADQLPYLYEIWQDQYQVSADLIEPLGQAQYRVRLQDFVNNQEQFLGPMNSAQQALKQRWLALHPPELLASIGIDS